MSETAASLVTQAKEHVEALDPYGFAEEAGNPNTVIVDLREADELASGVIPGSVHVPRGMLEFRADPTSSYHNDRLHPDHRVLLHCASGGRSALAAETLHRMGYGNVAHLDGGINAWNAAGLPVETPSAGS